MKNQSPKKNMECLEKVLTAWREFASSVTYGGVTLAEFEAMVNASRNDRVSVTEKDNEKLAAIVKRENDDSTALIARAAVVNGVVADPNFGPDSAFYQAMGYIRKSDRKSGLTRKSKNGNGSDE